MPSSITLHPQQLRDSDFDLKCVGSSRRSEFTQNPAAHK